MAVGGVYASFFWVMLYVVECIEEGGLIFPVELHYQINALLVGDVSVEGGYVHGNEDGVIVDGEVLLYVV